MQIKKLMFITFLCFSISACWETSKGNKIGTLVKCSYDGFLIKTYECELIKGGLSSGNGSFGRSFHFTVEDKSLIPFVESSLNDQKEINITYHKEWISLPWRTETEDFSFLDSVQVMK